MKIIVYTRQGCHLCDEAFALLAKHRGTLPLEIQAVDIDASAELAAKFGEMVPVIEVNGRPRLWGKINGPLLRRLLQTPP